ncbi:hypothetical protein [Blastococcus sp. CT_GayMR16]|uniref:hypothetical protein n=1 Tax=Blastococcus sp. CT_GayMR16 TaxID=2559607 RepID=UPI0010730942|nr:hypothetical protein [Blastococcus sp. CT_GayMR16]TFV90393.1 hypothetical protein E4P38_02835 [Blastococcus sp. CT_GayMR16]
MADLSVPLSDTTIVDGQAGHAALHSEVADYTETLRQWSRNLPVPETVASAWPNTVLLSSFAGATPADKLRAAMTYGAAQTFKPAILYVPTTDVYDAGATPFQLYDGFKLLGTGTESEFGYGSKMQVRGTNGVFALKPGAGARTQGVVLRDIDFEANVNTAGIFQEQASNGSQGILAYSHIENCSFDNFKWLIRLPMLGCFTNGGGHVNNFMEDPVRISGSDNILWPDGLMYDMSYFGPTTYGQRATEYLFEAASLSKTYVGPIYITGDPGTGVHVTGSNVGQLVFNGVRSEGRNSGLPSAGAAFRIEGANGVTLRDCWASYAMADPSATGRDDAGVIHVAGTSRVLIDGLWTDAGSSTRRQTVPTVYCASGATARVRNTMRGINWPGSDGLPRYSGAGSISVDDSMVAL